MKISYIIPVYNVEKYLRQCVDGLLCQSFGDFEIVLVDDGSLDGSPAICDEYAQRDGRVRVVHKQNGGVSDARNVGVNFAKGEYIIFVDSDDFWSDSGALQRLVDEGEKAGWPDMVAFNLMYYYPSTNEYKKWVRYSVDITEESDVNKVICALVRTGSMPMSPCSKMIRRSVLEKSGLKFIKGIIGEDTPWFIDLLQIVDSVKFVNDYIYCYRCEVAGSITHTFKEERYLQYIETTESLIPVIQNSVVFCEETKDALLSFVAYQFCIAAAGVYRLDGVMQKQTRKRIKGYMWLLKYRENPKVALAAKVYRLMGFGTLEIMLRYYLNHCKESK